MHQAPPIRKELWSGRRVLITGHTGFKGSWLGLWLSEAGAKVTGIGLPVDTEPHLFTQISLEERLHSHVIGDLCQPQLIKDVVAACKPDVVLHLAAQPLVRLSYSEPMRTWNTNVMGSLYLLEALRSLEHPCAVVMVTTDKVYQNREWVHGYRETDRLGGRDPYSASKAAAEIAIASFRESFCGDAPHQTPNLAVATARAGNVIGGGDWAADRIVPDAMRAFSAGKSVKVRNPDATRPWQHVLEALSGYLRLAEELSLANKEQKSRYADAFNFGPLLESNQPVSRLLEEIQVHWPESSCCIEQAGNAPHEAGQLHLQIDKAHHMLGWQPRWSFSSTVERTVNWYRSVHRNPGSAQDLCLADLAAYCQP